MANLTIRNQPTGTPARTAEWDPMKWARDLLRWDPFREMMPAYGTEIMAFAPAFEVKETKDGYLFTADVPGVPEKNLELTRTGNRLSISGYREEEKTEEKETHYLKERTYGSFQRVFTLPEGVDPEHVKAELDKGVLRLFVPKLPEAQPRKIAVQAGDLKKS